MMNEYQSMSKEKAFITKTFSLLSQYNELTREIAEKDKLDVTLRVNCLLGLLIVPQQKLNNSRFIQVDSEAEWGIILSEIEEYPRLTKNYDLNNNANAIAYHIRNSIAHNRFIINSNDGENITHIQFEDYTQSKPRKLSFRYEFSVDDLMIFTKKYYQAVLEYLS